MFDRTSSEWRVRASEREMFEHARSEKFGHWKTSNSGYGVARGLFMGCRAGVPSRQSVGCSRDAHNGATYVELGQSFCYPKPVVGHGCAGGMFFREHGVVRGVLRWMHRLATNDQ